VLVLEGHSRDLDPKRLQRLLEAPGTDALVIENVSIHPAEARIAAFLEGAAAPRGEAPAAQEVSFDWQALARRLEECGPFVLELRADRADERCRVDVVVRRRGSQGPRLEAPEARAAHVGTPRRAAALRELARELRGWLRERLPEALVPSALMAVGALPHTPNGKLDRRRLRALDPGPSAPLGGQRAPRTPLEAEIAELEAALLGLKNVGIADDFFELGGHSLLAAQLVATLRERYGVELPVQALFVSPTVEHLARLVDEELARKRRYLGDGAGRVEALVEELSDRDVDRMLSGLLLAGAAR
jgi:acyl carrier protein